MFLKVVKKAKNKLFTNNLPRRLDCDGVNNANNRVVNSTGAHVFDRANSQEMMKESVTPISSSLHSNDDHSSSVTAATASTGAQRVSLANRDIVQSLLEQNHNDCMSDDEIMILKERLDKTLFEKDEMTMFDFVTTSAEEEDVDASNCTSSSSNCTSSSESEDQSNDQEHDQSSGHDQSVSSRIPNFVRESGRKRVRILAW